MSEVEGKWIQPKVTLQNFITFLAVVCILYLTIGGFLFVSSVVSPAVTALYVFKKQSVLTEN